MRQQLSGIDPQHFGDIEQALVQKAAPPVLDLNKDVAGDPDSSANAS